MPDPSTRHLPRILCLHGGGVNAEVFELQCRAIIARLRPYFRLVFVNGPLPCAPHEKIVAVYGDQGPFFRWMPWLDAHSDVDDDAAAETIMRTCLDAMKRDSAAHSATGDWVGVLGFSQGAKIAASLLFAQEKAVKNGLDPLTSFRFGVIMAGSPPVVRLDTRLPKMPHVGGAGHITVETTPWLRRRCTC
jgi:predicted esterase